MHTTSITQHRSRAATVAAALVTIITACGGEPATDGASTAEQPVTPVVATSASAGTTDRPPVVDYSGVSFETAESTYLARRYGDATSMFTAYVARRPDNAWGHYMLGLSAWKSGDLDRAREALERSLELDPRHVKSLLNLGRVLLEQDRAGEAKERVQQAVALDSTSAEVHRMLGRVQTALGLPDEAIESYRTALVFDPADVWAMNNMALLFIQRERHEDALGPLARAVQLRPGAPVFQNNLGIALERTGHIAEARDAYRAALAADSTYGKAQASLARLEGVEPGEETPAVELSVLADGFEREVQRWREERLATHSGEQGGVAVVPEILTSVPDTLVPEEVARPPR